MGVAMSKYDTDDAHWRDVLKRVRFFAESWEPGARIVGNIRACDIARACQEVLELGDESLPSLLEACGALKDAPGESVEIVREIRNEWGD